MSYILEFLFSTREALSSPSQFVYYTLALLDNAIQNNTILTIAERGGGITAVEHDPSSSGSNFGGAETSAPPPPPDSSAQAGDSVSTRAPSAPKVVRVPPLEEKRDSAHKDEHHHPLQGSSVFSNTLTSSRLKRNMDAARFVATHAQFHQLLQQNPQFVMLKELLLSQDALWSRESEGPMPLVYTDEEMALAAALLPPEQLANEKDIKKKKKPKKEDKKHETTTEETYTTSEVQTPQLSAAEAISPRGNSVVVRRETLYDVFYNGKSWNLRELVDDINRGLADTTLPPPSQEGEGEEGHATQNRTTPAIVLRPASVFELHEKCKEVARLSRDINTTLKKIQSYEARLLKENERSAAARAFTRGKRRDLTEKLQTAQKEFETLSESYKETLKTAHQLLTRHCEEIYFCFKRKFIQNCRMLADALHVEMTTLASGVATQSDPSLSMTRREDTFQSSPQSLSATHPAMVSPNTMSSSISKGNITAKEKPKPEQEKPTEANEGSGDDLRTLDRPVSFQLASPMLESYHSGPAAVDAEAAAMLSSPPPTTINTSAHHNLVTEDSAASRLRPEASTATTVAPPSNPLHHTDATDPNGISAADLAAINTLQEEESVNLFFSCSASSVPNNRIRDLSKLKHRKGEPNTQAGAADVPPDTEQSQDSTDLPATVAASANNSRSTRDVTDSMGSATKRNGNNSNGGSAVYAKELVLTGVRTREIFFRYFFFHACKNTFFRIFSKYMLALHQFRRISQKLNYNLPHRMDEDMKQLTFFLTNLQSDKSMKAYDKLDANVFTFRKKLEVLQWRNKSVQEAKEKVEHYTKKLTKGSDKALEAKLEKWQELKSTRQTALNDYLQSNFETGIFDMLSYYTEFLTLTESSLNQFLSSVPEESDVSQDAVA